MKTKNRFVAVIASAVILPTAIFASLAIAGSTPDNSARPEGPCDVYAKNGAPCVAAHSSTRALYASYNGPLYQVVRASDGQTLDIGVVQPSDGDPGGYADAAAQDEFCANTTCWVSILYDQSGKGNHLQQAPRGGFSGHAMGGFNNVPIADMAPVTIMNHKVYGLAILPGMGLRWNDATGTAVDDQAEGQYWVISGHHYNTGCCFDYGNAETDSRDDGDGTMETTYFGNGRAWYQGTGTGPWIETDQENNLVGCVNPDPNDKFCPDLPTINWRFVTATADGEPHHWRSMGGNAQGGELAIMYDGQRIQNPRNSYDPMRKQGAILLGNGGDNSVGSAGTFYEAAMTAAGTFPTIECNQAVQANVVAAGYDVQRLAVNAADKNQAPNGLQTFTPKSTEYTSVTFVNTTGKEITDLSLSIKAPRGWKANVMGGKGAVRKIGYKVAPGQKVVVNFAVRSGRKEFNGDLVANASWTDNGKSFSEKAVEKVRNVKPIKINEFASGNADNVTNAFIELYNDSDKPVNISGYSITTHAINIPYFSSIRIPRGTKIAPKGFYLLGLATSGLSVDAAKGDDVLYLRSVKGIKVGDKVIVGTGKNAEERIVAEVTEAQLPPPAQGMPMFRMPAPLGTPTTLWQPLPEGPVITIPAGSTNIPVTSVTGFKVGDKMAIGYGAQYPAVSNSLEKYEVVTVTEVGKPGTQAWLAYEALPGETNIKVSSVENISVGDRIRLDIASEGHGIETVTVKSVGTASSLNPNNNRLTLEEAGTGLELEAPLKYAHSANIPFSVNGTGISFEPASKFDHSSNEPVLALVFSIKLDKPLAKNHPIDDAVVCENCTEAGYVGEVPADQLFGGPALSGRGNITLRNAKGLVVDALNYGLVVDPWLGEGYQLGGSSVGSYAPSPVAQARRFGAQPSVAAPRSSGRFPDGHDTDDNMLDFRVQSSSSVFQAAEAGADVLVMNACDGIKPGQTVMVMTAEGMVPVKIGTIGDKRTEVTLVPWIPGRPPREVRVDVQDLYLAEPPTAAFDAGLPIVVSLPTPGMPNIY